MELNDYQTQAMTTCMESSNNFSYMFLNLVGEVGEFASKVAKQIRKENLAIGGSYTLNRNELTFTQKGYLEDIISLKVELEKEAGDILWQLAGLCKVMGWDLEEVAQMNLGKLAARKEANTIDGSGDGISGADRR